MCSPVEGCDLRAERKNLRCEVSSATKTDRQKVHAGSRELTTVSVTCDWLLSLSLLSAGEGRYEVACVSLLCAAAVMWRHCVHTAAASAHFVPYWTAEHGFLVGYRDNPGNSPRWLMTPMLGS